MFEERKRGEDTFLMMTLTDIQNANINKDVAREAYEQSTKRLDDLLDTKASHEQKAFALLAGSLTLGIALFGLVGFAISVTTPSGGVIPAFLVTPFMVAGTMLIVAAVFYVVALWDRDYGARGSDPAMWLCSGTIDGGDSAMAAMLAYVAFHNQQRIDVSRGSNKEKRDWIRAGIVVDLLAPAFLAIWFLVRWSATA